MYARYARQILIASAAVVAVVALTILWPVPKGPARNDPRRVVYAVAGRGQARLRYIERNEVVDKVETLPWVREMLLDGGEFLYLSALAEPGELVTTRIYIEGRALFGGVAEPIYGAASASGIVP